MPVRYIHCPHCGHPSVVRREELPFTRRCRQCAGAYAPMAAIRKTGDDDAARAAQPPGAPPRAARRTA